MTRNRLKRTIFVLCVIAVSSLPIQAQVQNVEKVSMCQLIAQPNSFVGKVVRLRVNVHIFRHGTAISDSECSGKTLLLITNQKASELNSVSKFYEFLSQHRQSSNPVVAEIVGCLVKGSEHGFVLKRNYDFQIDSVSSFSEGDGRRKR